MQEAFRQYVIVAVILIVMVALGAGISRYNVTTADTITPSASYVEPIRYSGETGKTVLELLERNHTVETAEDSFGTTVTSIDGIANNPPADGQETGGSIWFYYVQDPDSEEQRQGLLEPNVTQTEDGQEIEWRYEHF